MQDESRLTRRTFVAGALISLPVLAAGAGAASAAEQSADARPLPLFIRPRLLMGVYGLVSTSLVSGGTYSGTVEVLAQFDLAKIKPLSVLVAIGPSVREMRPIGTSGVWRAAPWDTTEKLGIPGELSPNNYCAWVTFTVTTSTSTTSTPVFPVYTGNYSYGTLPNRGWQPELGWAADYSSREAWLASFSSPVIGERWTSLVDDPVLGKSRKAIRATIPDFARFDSDQPTQSPRFQAQQSTSSPYRGLNEGHEFYVGFSVYVPTRNSSAYGSGGFPSVALSRANETNKHIAIFQIFGPQASAPTKYPAGRGPITVINANRTASTDPTDRFQISANALNGGDQEPVIDFGYNRGAWTDIVLGFRVSADIKRGWMEAYLNQGASSTVRPVKLFGGRTRIPRVSLWPEWSSPAVPVTYSNGTAIVGGSANHRTDMQIYRAPSAYNEVTLFHTAHRVGPDVESVDPRSYA